MLLVALQRAFLLPSTVPMFWKVNKLSTKKYGTTFVILFFKPYNFRKEFFAVYLALQKYVYIYFFKQNSL